MKLSDWRKIWPETAMAIEKLQGWRKTWSAEEDEAAELRVEPGKVYEVSASGMQPLQFSTSPNQSGKSLVYQQQMMSENQRQYQNFSGQLGQFSGALMIEDRTSMPEWARPFSQSYNQLLGYQGQSPWAQQQQQALGQSLQQAGLGQQMQQWTNQQFEALKARAAEKPKPRATRVPEPEYHPDHRRISLTEDDV